MLDGHPIETQSSVDAARAAEREIDLDRHNGAPYDTVNNSTIIIITLIATFAGGVLLDNHAYFTGIFCEFVAALGFSLLIHRIENEKFE